MHLLCPHCHNTVDLDGDAASGEVLCRACGSSFRLERQATTDWSPPEGGRKLGKYELIDAVGTGAFGTVYKARDPGLDRVVAIKVPRAGHLASRADLDRFLREARSVAQLRHPSIVSVFEVGQAEQLPYLVSEFVQGVTLADLLSARRPSPREAAQLVAAVADALQYAHEMGVVHRDVKPGNIMLDEQGSPRLMDFGLAKREAGDVTMTVEGQVLGTPAYMSPEQARGEAHQVDGRSDVYSLGVILYELLTGELPFRGTARMLLHQVLHDDPRRPRSLNDAISRDLETVCLKAMAKEPGGRYATARDMAEDLRRFLKGEPIQARPMGQPERLWRWCRRNPALAGLTAAVTALLLVVAGSATVAAFQYRLLADQEEQRRKEAEDRADAEAKAKEKLETTVYFQRITLAHRELLENNLLKAEELLDQCPADHRAWEWYYLKRLCHVEPVTLRGQLGGWLQKGAFSPDGQRLASVSEDKSVKIWDATTGQELLTLPSTEEVLCMAFRPPEGRWFVTGSTSGAVTIWDTTTRQVVRTLGRHMAAVNDLAFSPDGRRLASLSGEGMVTVYDATRWPEKFSQEPLVAFRAHKTWVRGRLAFSPGGQRLVAPGDENAVNIWDVTTTDKPPSAPQLTLRGHTAQVWDVAFSPDGRWVASGGEDNMVRLWDAKTGALIRPFRGHSSIVSRVAFSPDGKRLASASFDKTVKVWDLTQLDKRLKE